MIYLSELGTSEDIDIATPFTDGVSQASDLTAFPLPLLEIQRCIRRSHDTSKVRFPHAACEWQ